MTIYIKEAHPDDEWQMRVNEREDIVYDQPTSLDERLKIAREFVDMMDYDIEVVVDNLNDEAEKAYAAWPERLYVIDSSGKVSFKGGMGPQGFDVDQVEEWLVENLTN